MHDLERAIREDLDDDAPRLVYADYLAERGDPLGELIHVQCRIARLAYPCTSAVHDWILDANADDAEVEDEVRRLRTRSKALLAANEETWFPASFGARATWGRGFVEEIEWNRTSRRTVESIFAMAPMTTRLEIVQRGDDAGPLSSPDIAQLRHLAYAVQGTMPKAAVLRNPRLSGLRSLKYEVEEGADEDAAELAGATFIENLRAVDLSTSTKMRAGHLETILGAASNLEELQIRGRKLGPDAAAAIAAARSRKLRTLALLENGLGAGGVETLRTAPNLGELRALDVRKNHIKEAGAKALGAGFGSVRTLDLTGNSLRRQGVEALVSGGGLGSLRNLWLQQTTLDDDALAALADAPLLSQLRHLSLRSNKITNEGAARLAESKHTSMLRSINLSNNGLTRAGLERLRDAIPRARIVAR